MAIKSLAAMLVVVILGACGSDAVAPKASGTNVVSSVSNPPVCDIGMKNQDCIDWIVSIEGQCHRAISCVRHSDSTGSPIDSCVIGSASPQAKSCDDGNTCTTGDTCDGIGLDQCKGTQVNCDDGSPCTSDSCDKKQGCVHTAIAAQCSDNSACTTGDVCKDSVCVGTKLDCDDKNPCTSDSCDTAKGCVNAPNTNSCDDGNVCTEGDVCKDSSCASGAAKVCEDNNVCTDDSCDAKSGCKFVAKSDKAITCSDKDPTTADDACVAGVCVGKPFFECESDDGCAMTVKTVCGKPICVPVDPSKPDEKTCKVEFTLNVDDNNPCTKDSCDYIKGPVHEAIIGKTCDDGDACTTPDTCAADKSCKGATKQCDDADACTLDSCDKNTGACVHKQETCEDGNPFTENFCSLGTCKSVAGVIAANAQMPESYTAKEIVDNNLSTKLTSWVEDAAGKMSMNQPIIGVITLDAKGTCEVLYLGSKLCFNAWLLIGATAETINIGGGAVVVKDSTMKDGSVIKPKSAGVSYYDLADACLGWQDIPICVAAKGK